MAGSVLMTAEQVPGWDMKMSAGAWGETTGGRSTHDGEDDFYSS